MQFTTDSPGPLHGICRCCLWGLHKNSRSNVWCGFSLSFIYLFVCLFKLSGHMWLAVKSWGTLVSPVQWLEVRLSTDSIMGWCGWDMWAAGRGQLPWSVQPRYLAALLQLRCPILCQRSTLRFWRLGAAINHINNESLTGLPSTFKSHLHNSKINFCSQRHIPTDQLNNSFSNKILMHTNFLLSLPSILNRDVL